MDQPPIYYREMANVYQVREALRTPVESRGLPNNSTCVLEALPSLGIKRGEPGFLFISLPIGSDYDVFIDFFVDSVSLATSFKKRNVIMTR